MASVGLKIPVPASGLGVDRSMRAGRREVESISTLHIS